MTIKCNYCKKDIPICQSYDVWDNDFKFKIEFCEKCNRKFQRELDIYAKAKKFCGLK